MPFLTMMIVIITLLIFLGLSVISHQLKDIYDVLVEITSLLKRSDNNAR